MRRRARALLLASLLVAACSDSASPSAAPDVTSSAAAASIPATTPSAVPSATIAPGEVRIPLENGQSPVNADSDALVVVRRLIDGHTTRVEAIELKTGKVTTVRETVDAAVTVPAIRDGVITLVETQETGAPQEFRFRVFAGRWRDPASIVQLDDLTLTLGGGDSWNPVPEPQTNGWEVAWRHAAGATQELRVRDADGTIHTVYSSKSPFTFALGRNGDVAIGDLGTSGDVALRLYSGGATKVLATRPAAEQGYVVWQSGRIVWSKGLGLVVPVLQVERIEPGTLSREAVALPTGCFSWSGGTDAQIAFACGDHIELVGPGPSRVGPPLPLLHARGIIRTEQGPPPIAFVTPVVTDDPRPGAGARF